MLCQVSCALLDHQVYTCIMSCPHTSVSAQLCRDYTNQYSLLSAAIVSCLCHSGSVMGPREGTLSILLAYVAVMRWCQHEHGASLTVQYASHTYMLRH